MEILINDLIEQSQKRLKYLENQYMNGDTYHVEQEWIRDVAFIKGRIEGYERVLQLMKSV